MPFENYIGQYEEISEDEYDGTWDGLEKYIDYRCRDMAVLTCLAEAEEYIKEVISRYPQSTTEHKEIRNLFIALNLINFSGEALAGLLID